MIFTTLVWVTNPVLGSVRVYEGSMEKSLFISHLINYGAAGALCLFILSEGDGILGVGGRGG